MALLDDYFWRRAVPRALAAWGVDGIWCITLTREFAALARNTLRISCFPGRLAVSVHVGSGLWAHKEPGS